MEVAPESATRVGRDIYSVSRLNREARVLLERGFGTLWVEAEISNFSRPTSGHWYFSLKDANAQVRCAMFRQRNMLSTFTARGRLCRVRICISCWGTFPAQSLMARMLGTSSTILRSVSRG